mmetsp:Transcript_24048/g.78235  ORF Transcript_24048/g.78235 Transcript_24048/m.78235 type:complete len:455 (+) Transcript_24048:259-1623(+)
MSRPSSSLSLFPPDQGIPFLPGNSFSDPNRTNFRKSHIFDYRSGTPIQHDVPIRDDGAPASPSRPPSVVPSQVSNYRSISAENSSEFIPAFAGLDGKVLRFEAFITEQVPENLSEPSRVRKFTILYHLVDDSIQINEHRQQNSGYAQGVFMKRHRVPKQELGSQEFVTLFDFASTTVINIYNREFHLTSCNHFTQNFFEANGLNLEFESIIPEDKYMSQRALSESKMNRGAASPMTTSSYNEILDNKSEDTYRVESSIATLTTAQKRDMREKFLKYANKVLRFYAQWDDRSSMFGQKLEYIINYFLQDDKIEVLEVKQQNSGRDPFPKLVKKQRVPRVFRGVPSVGSKEEDFEDEYISDKDLIVGNTIEIFGRDMFLYDCDSFTREYYLHQYGVEQPANQVEPETHVEFPSMPLPPYNGFGSEHDSLASYFNLIPKPRKYDRTKQAALDSIIFR